MDTEYQKLLEKYLRLKEENEQLRSQLITEPIKDGSESQSSETQIQSVNQISSAEDKIKLFLSYINKLTNNDDRAVNSCSFIIPFAHMSKIKLL